MPKISIDALRKYQGVVCDISESLREQYIWLTPKYRSSKGWNPSTLMKVVIDDGPEEDYDFFISVNRIVKELRPLSLKFKRRISGGQVFQLTLKKKS